MQKHCKDSLEMRLQECDDGYEFQETASHYKPKLFVYCLSNFFRPGGTENKMDYNPLAVHPTWHGNWGKGDS